MKVYLTETKLKGKWHKVTYQQAFEGEIGKLFFSYTLKKENDVYFYGITSHDDHDGFRYFIGEQDHMGDLILPSGYYHQEVDIDIAYEQYQVLATKLKDTKALFNGSFEFDRLPTKIEVYHYLNDTVTLEMIYIPLEK